MPWTPPEEIEDLHEIVAFISKRKVSLRPSDICVGKAAPLLDFMNAVFDLKFDETPHYSKLKHILNKILLNKNIAPNPTRLDWLKKSSSDIAKGTHLAMG